MIKLLNLHKANYGAMSAQETFKDRENEFNKLIESYELNPLDIANYLLVIRDTKKERAELIHELLDNYEYANALVEITELLINNKKNEKIYSNKK